MILYYIKDIVSQILVYFFSDVYSYIHHRKSTTTHGDSYDPLLRLRLTMRNCVVGPNTNTQ